MIMSANEGKVFFVFFFTFLSNLDAFHSLVSLLSMSCIFLLLCIPGIRCPVPPSSWTAGYFCIPRQSPELCAGMLLEWLGKGFFPLGLALRTKDMRPGQLSVGDIFLRWQGTALVSALPDASLTMWPSPPGGWGKLLVSFLPECCAVTCILLRGRAFPRPQVVSSRACAPLWSAEYSNGTHWGCRVLSLCSSLRSGSLPWKAPPV